MTYTITPPPTYPANGGNPIALPQSLTLAWEWDSPYSAVGFPNLGDYNANASITEVSLVQGGAGQFQTNTEPTEFWYTAGINGVVNGYYADFGVSQALPSGLLQPDTNAGYRGDAVVITGKNFDTTGLTEVFFNGSRSQSVSCANSTTCTAVAPVVGSVASGAVPVTVSVLGEVTNVGNYSYEPAGPNCVYSYKPGATPTIPGSAATFDAACIIDSAGDPISIYELVSGSWQVVYRSYLPYPGNTFQQPGPASPFLATIVGTSGTFIACNESSSLGLSSPGENGCDVVSTNLAAPVCVPATESAACAAAAMCGGGVSDGCGGTISCEPADCNTGNCTQSHCCVVGTTWNGTKCYAPGVVTCPSGYEYCGSGCVKGKCQ
jgi:hypothetical protein